MLINQGAKLINTWLILCCISILFITAVGGFTRLTGAGLSITEWKPVTGIIPPLSNAAWEQEFNKYKTIPEFQHVNYNMQLDDFKSIYITEYSHRVIARMIFLLFTIPFILFHIAGNLNRTQFNLSLAAVILLLLQGIVGWLMVKSGLTVNTHVSHFRLALHFTMAIAIFAVLCKHLTYNYQQNSDNNIASKQTVSAQQIKKQNMLVHIGATLLLLQIIMGCLTAGLKAGLLSDTFPKMYGQIIPQGAFTTGISAMIYDPLTIHFMHRLLGTAFLLYTIYLLIHFKHYTQNIKRAIVANVTLATVQFGLGIITILSHVNISVAIIHQVCAMLLAGSFVYTILQIKQQKHTNTIH